MSLIKDGYFIVFFITSMIQFCILYFRLDEKKTKYQDAEKILLNESTDRIVSNVEQCHFLLR